ncbi:MAG: serine/threonine-protein phosphatase [Phycisphaerales bacterium]|nr:serine/threonine-protein phosphatase [Phycisphaerales bacterium]
MPSPSLTSSDSFRLRAQLSEQRRLALMAIFLAILIAFVFIRHLLGGAIFSAGPLYTITLSILAAGLLYQLASLADIHRFIRAGRVAPAWRAPLHATVDVLIPFGLLTFLHIYSPDGPVSALSAPALLIFPFIILLSVLRLRPRLTLFTGAAAAAGHALLTARTVAIAEIPPHHAPQLASYGVALLITAIAGFIVAREVKRYVLETVEETAARERAGAQLAAVQRDLSVARDIQRGLLPSSAPVFPGFDIAGMNRPADLTGGDYYDWQPLPDGRLAVVMADVTGHGIGPALVMAVCRAYARASTPLASDSISLLARLNNLLHADLSDGRFITFALAIIDPAGRVDLLSAGHGPTLLFRAATGQVEEFGGDGIPLGIIADETYGPVRSFSLEPRDVLVLLTDGFFEWQRPADQQAFGIPRLAETLRDAAAGPAQSILDRLDSAVRAFTAGATQPDDMTAVVIRRAG